MVFAQDQHVFILEHYFSTRSCAECQNVFRNSFPDSVVPNKSTIQRLVERFSETGSIGEKRRSGRRPVLSNDSLEDIRARVRFQVLTAASMMFSAVFWVVLVDNQFTRQYSPEDNSEHIRARLLQSHYYP
jgi:hypothetical protein